MPADRNAQRIVLAGASSLLGNEVKSLLEESRFAGWDLRLVDEEPAVGTITEAAGEAAIIQRVEEDTFKGARFAFLATSQAFGRQCLGPARAAGATVIDFSHAALSDPDATPWFSRIESLTGMNVLRSAKTFSVFSVGGMAVASLALALRRYGVHRLMAVLNEPVSESGREGIEELETQTSQLLSFQSIGNPVFGTQAAFTMLPHFGNESRQSLQQGLLEMRAEVSSVLTEPGEDAKISMNLVHAPVFYGMAFSICVDLGEEVEAAALAETCRAAGFTIVPATEEGPSNVSVAGESGLFLSEPRAELTRAQSWWFWGVGDNLRVPAWNGLKLAELLDS